MTKNGNGDPGGRGSSVLVVGAGPTGLLLASELQRRGVPCHLIDDRSAPLHWDRATVVHPRSLEIFDSLGIAERFLEVGARQRVIKMHSGGEVIGMMDLSNCGSVYGFNLGVSEEVTESILTEYLHGQGGGVNRSSRLTGLRPHAEGVLAEIERDGKPYEVDVRWVVGCDGIHSAARELSGIGLEGHDIAKPWAVFDATLQGWTDSFETTFVYLEQLPVIFTALPGQRWRVYLRPSSDHSDLVEDAASTLRTYAPAASFVGVENLTRFHCHTKVATRFRSGAVFLAGDAAHICSPAQGHGMNCGLQDVFNLAWKLALVHHGVAEETLLDTYESERRPAAEIVTKSGDATEEVLMTADPMARDSRDQAIRAMLADPKLRHHEVTAETELDIEYSQSSIVFGDTNAYFAAGQRLPSTIRAKSSAGQACRLHELAHGAGHTLMLLGGPSASGPALVELHLALQEITQDSPLLEEAIALGTSADLPVQIGNIEPGAADLLGVDGITLFAVRPDGYLGLRADRDHLAALERYRTLVHAGHA